MDYVPPKFFACLMLFLFIEGAYLVVNGKILLRNGGMIDGRSAMWLGVAFMITSGYAIFKSMMARS